MACRDESGLLVPRLPARLPRMPVHRDRSRVHEARVAGLAITLSVAALILVLVYVIGGYASHVIVVIVDSTPAASVR